MRIGSTGANENRTIAEIYAAALEREGITVVRDAAYADPQSALAALKGRDIDIFPGQIGTTFREADKSLYQRRYGITWLTPSPANLSPCLVTSQYSAEQFWLLRMTKCAAIARQLRLAATPDFLAPGGPLQKLRHAYGGFDFKEISQCDPGTQYDALNRGDADVANGFTTDPNIAETQLIVLSDDKHFWPDVHAAPFVRIGALRTHPRLAPVLNRISSKLTIYALQQLSRRQHLFDMSPRNAGEEFVSSHTAH